MKKKIITASIVAVMLIAGGYYIFNDKEDVEITKYTYFEYFDTIIDVSFYEEVDEEMEEKIENRLSEIHDLTNNFEASEANGIYDLNNDLEIAYNEEIAGILEYAIDYYNDYSVEFNVALGPVIDVWKTYLNDCNENSVCELPSDSELEEASNNIDPNNIEISEKLIKIEEEMKVDLGGIAKGHAADEVSVLLKDNDYRHYLINAGGNIITTTKPTSEKFIISIIDPVDNTNTFITLYVEDAAVVTSGDYERYYEVDDVRYSHLISPTTLYPATNFHSVSVVAKTSMEADIWTTTLFNLDYETGLALVEDDENVEAIWYDTDGNIYKSSGIENYEES